MKAAPAGMTERRLALLERLAATGSILSAAKDVGMSYRGAWLAIEAMNAAAPSPLVERRAGGKGGGGTRLTPAGRRLVEASRRLGKDHASVLQRAGGRERDLGEALGWLRRLSVRTSARNQFFGRVVSLKLGPVSAEVVLALKGGDRLCAVITRESAEDLALRRGAEAFALIKASWIMLAADGPEPRVSARNRYRGVVERVQLGKVNADAVLRLPGGERLWAVVTRESARELKLTPGRRAWALFKASSVIVGIQA